MHLVYFVFTVIARRPARPSAVMAVLERKLRVIKVRTFRVDILDFCPFWSGAALTPPTAALLRCYRCEIYKDLPGNPM